METIIAIKRVSYSALEVTFINKQSFILPAKLLRTVCPCAECREKQSSQDETAESEQTKRRTLKIIKHTDQERLRIEKIWQVGNYAIGVLWGDGHKTGIYKFEFLAKLVADLSSETNK
ncbi:MAG TPA: DUF971 domain-containing protein [Oligoflexia bacterium]|nr:DUF971 domain-containing protein [Oligoflexia bacterium]HMP26554.1 DUF971 domain-containing protein [Oligoflexia bacterium]